MFKESVILIAVLDALMAGGIPALGLHDGLLVPQSKAEEVEAVMIEKAMEVAWGYIPVSNKVVTLETTPSTMTP